MKLMAKGLEIRAVSAVKSVTGGYAWARTAPAGLRWVKAARMPLGERSFTNLTTARRQSLSLGSRRRPGDRQGALTKRKARNEVVQADPDLNQWFLATPRWAVGLSPKKWRMESCFWLLTSRRS